MTYHCCSEVTYLLRRHNTSVTSHICSYVRIRLQSQMPVLTLPLWRYVPALILPCVFDVPYLFWRHNTSVTLHTCSDATIRLWSQIPVLTAHFLCCDVPYLFWHYPASLTSHTCSDITLRRWRPIPVLTLSCVCDVIYLLSYYPASMTSHTCSDVTLLLQVSIVLDLALGLIDEVAAGDGGVGALLVLVRCANLNKTNSNVSLFFGNFFPACAWI